MNESIVAHTLSKMTKLLLAPVGPLQYMLDSPGITHVHCLEQAYLILEHDNKQRVAELFAAHHTLLKKGLLWADRGWKNVCHYYGQADNQGSIRWPGAAAECQYYFNKAMSLFPKDMFKGMFYLGAALHLVQDMCVPHHSVGVVFDGHQEFEKWATKHWHRFPALTGIYPVFSHPVQWIDHNARLSAPLYPLVSLENQCTKETYERAAAKLIPLTIATTAGFLDFTRKQLSGVTLGLIGK